MREATLERAFLDDAIIDAAWRAAGAVTEAAVTVERAHDDPGEALRRIVKTLGDAGLLSLLVNAEDGGAFDTVRWRAVCLARERLGYASPLVELAFAMQGLGSYAITHSGTAEQKEKFLPGVVRGDHVAAFALTEPEAGSDLAGLATTARREGDAYVLDGHKVLISNAPVADLFTLFAATAPIGERRRVSAFVVRADAAGLRATPTKVLGGHPIGELHLDGVRVPARDRLGDEGDGMRVALGTLHRFRPTVGAAALGFAQRALDESIAHTTRRRQFGAPLSELAAVQMALADMACDIEAARLLVYRAAALADDGGGGREREARHGSMAKLVATEAASRVVDRAVQLHGGRGVTADCVVARLYEDVRSLRIYEGASDIQKVLIARSLLSEALPSDDHDSRKKS